LIAAPFTQRRAPRQALVAVNCGAMPENLVESILFGHEKGSFTVPPKGTTAIHRGRRGTLFLDEVGECRAAQVKLLRALQEGEVEPVGGRGASSRCRIVSATTGLIADVKAGRFREEPVLTACTYFDHIPPLRQRLDDIPPRPALPGPHRREEGKRVRGIGTKALDMLAAYRWPGNGANSRTPFPRLVLSTAKNRRQRIPQIGRRS